MHAPPLYRRGAWGWVPVHGFVPIFVMHADLAPTAETSSRYLTDRSATLRAPLGQRVLCDVLSSLLACRRLVEGCIAIWSWRRLAVPGTRELAGYQVNCRAAPCLLCCLLACLSRSRRRLVEGGPPFARDISCPAEGRCNAVARKHPAGSTKAPSPAEGSRNVGSTKAPGW